MPFPSGNISFWHSHLREFHNVHNGPKGLQDRHKTAEEAPETAEEGTKTAPREGPECTKTAQEARQGVGGVA